jgi:2-oxo-4-hydroxy-4-carboxy--5-ureidoimidazoline (OHCU) decarboxylase
MPALPDIGTVPGLPTESRAEILDLLFEPCTQLHTLSVTFLQENTFESYSGLIAGVGAQLTALLESTLISDANWLDAILSAHPRLGEKKVANLSEASQKEQAKLQGGPAEEGEKLKALNEEYERRFPGLRYVYVRPFFSLSYRGLILSIIRKLLKSSHTVSL